MSWDTRYEPSNSDDGCFFMERFCNRCFHEKFNHTQNDDDRKCDILTAMMVLHRSDDDYPKELTYDDHGQPTCTKFKYTSWFDLNGNLIEEPEPETLDPNQLRLEL